MVVDGKWVNEYVPLGITVDAAEPTARAKQHMCMDKGYDFPEVHKLLYKPYLVKNKKRKQIQRKRKSLPTYKSKHWVVERTFLDESTQTTVDMLGKEIRKLYWNVAFCLCMDYLSKCGTFRIGSKLACNIPM